MDVAAKTQAYNFTSALARTVVKYESLSAAKKADFQRAAAQGKVTSEKVDVAKQEK
jgi:hypothetical protein